MKRRTFIKGLLALPFAAYFLKQEQPNRVRIERIEPVEFKPDPNARRAYAVEQASALTEAMDRNTLNMMFHYDTNPRPLIVRWSTPSDYRDLDSWDDA